MSVGAFNLVTSLLALSAIGLAVVAAIPNLRDRLRWTPARMMTAAALVAVTSTGGSLIYSGYFGYEPCRLCWYQRIAMYPLAWLLVAAVRRRDLNIASYVGPLALAGLATSVYHYVIQTFPSLEGSTSCSLTAPCSARWVSQFGFISIPFMAGCGFLAIVTLTYFSRRLERS